MTLLRRRFRILAALLQIGAALVLLSGLCAECASTLAVFGLPLAALAPVALGAGLFVLVASLRSRPAAESDGRTVAADLVVLGQSLVGVGIGTLAVFRGIPPCAACVALWLGVGALAVETLSRRSAHAPSFRGLAGLGAACCGLLAVHPSGRAALGAISTVPVVRHHAVRAGARLDLPDGLHVFVTDCAPCAVSRLKASVADARRAGVPVRVHSLENQPDILRPLAPEGFQMATPAEFRRLGLAPDGEPWLVRIEGGRVVAQGSRLEAKR